MKVHNAIVALVGAEIRLGELSNAFLRSTVRDPIELDSEGTSQDTTDGNKIDFMPSPGKPVRGVGERWCPYPIAPFDWCNPEDAHHGPDLLVTHLR